MNELVVGLSIACGSGALGLSLALLIELRTCRKALLSRTKEVEEIFKVASEANLSHADKILQIDERLASLEFKITAQAVTNNTGWKKPNG